MKIIYLHQYFNTPDMNGGTRSYEIARRLVAAGHEVEMITTDRSGQNNVPGWRNSVEEGINVHWLNLEYHNRMGFAARVKAFLHFAYAAARKANEIDGDIIFATSTPLTIAIPAIIKKYLSKKPMVFEVRDLWPELPIAIGALKNPILKFMAKRLEHAAYHNSEAVIALSPGMKDGVVATGYNPKQICVIPNSCDIDAFTSNDTDIAQFRSERQWLADNPLLLYAGTLGEINGVGYLVGLAKALEAINSPIKTLIVGEGKERELIIAQAKSAGVLEKNLFIENYRSKKEMPAMFGAADMSLSLFVDLPPMRSNSANKFFDALASGTPIMINYGGWQADIIKNNEAGIVTWQMSFHDAAQHLHQHMMDKKWLESASKNSHKLSIDTFSRDKLVYEFEQVLQLVLNGKADQVSKLNEWD